jgi:hypothetical protein
MGICFSTSRKAGVRPAPARSEIVYNDAIDKASFKVYRILPYDDHRPRKPHI